MGKWQQKEGVHQTIAPSGNWGRKPEGSFPTILEPWVSKEHQGLVLTAEK
jgi:hypothetical protein